MITLDHLDSSNSSGLVLTCKPSINQVPKVPKVPKVEAEDLSLTLAHFKQLNIGSSNSPS